MYKFFLSFRYFRSRFLALAAFLAIMFGVAMLFIVQSVMGGYMVQVRENIRGQEAHIQILGRGQLGLMDLLDVEAVVGSHPNVLGTAPFIERLGIFRSGVAIRPARVHGIQPVRQAQISDFGRYALRPEELDEILEKHVPKASADPDAPYVETNIPDAIRETHELVHAEGREPLSQEELERFFSLDFRFEMFEKHQPVESDQFEIPPSGAIIGIHMLLERDVSIGDILSVSTLSPDGFGGREINESFLVVGAAKTGDFINDSGTIYCDVEVARSMLNEFLPDGADPFRYQGLRVALKNPSRLEETRSDLDTMIIGQLGRRLRVKTWKELRQNMLKAVGIEKSLVYFIVLILVFFTGSMILLMLLLTVIEKTRDIGVLTALGATPGGVTLIFLLNGLVISAIGTIAGLTLGGVFCANINEIHDAIYAATGRQLFPPEIYQMDRIPTAFLWLDVVTSTVPPILIGLLASLIPAVWAPRRDPIKAIQFE